MRRFWTNSELEIVRQLYPHRPTKEIAAKLKRSVGSVYQAAEKLGLHKTAEFCASPLSGIIHKGEHRGVENQFKKGQVPPNKGLRRPGYERGRMKETQFRKGQRSGKAAENLRPIGTILTDSDGYLRIKVREAVYGKEATGFGNTKVWPLLQRHVWEEHHGAIPDKHIVMFKDRNRANCAIENLECISMAENARRNNMWNRYPREVAEAIQLIGAVKRKLRRKERNHGSKK